MLELLKKFNILLDKKEKRRVGFFLLISVVGACFEMLGVSIVVPLMTVILDSNITADNAFVASLCRLLHIHSDRSFLVLCLAAMIALFIVKDLFLVFKNRYAANLIYTNRFIMQQKMLRAFLHKPYDYFLEAQSGEILRVIRTDVMNTYSLLDQLLSLCSELIVSAALILVVILIDPFMTLLITVLMTVIMLIIIKLIRPVLAAEGVKYRSNLTKTYKWMLQSVQGIKEIKIGRREDYFERCFEGAGRAQVESEKRYFVLNSIPRIIIEMGCICSALLAMLIMIRFGADPKSLLPAYAAFAMAAVKLMPAFTRIIHSVSSVSYHGPAIDRLLENMQTLTEAEAEAEKPKMTLTLREKAELRHVTFRYPSGAEPVLEDASMVIPAGHTVGIVGVSGAGKTTAVDVLLGLLQAQQGEILCDGVNVTENYPAWLSLIGYIPQTIFLLDGSIRENVIFGSDVADDDKVWKVLEDAKLADFVREQPDGLDTEVGERGIRLSGGQRQRVGIARALYNDPVLLVFDEATSSLDTETESAILESINALHGRKTMIIIAHRLQTIENCDIVYRVKDRKIVQESP